MSGVTHTMTNVFGGTVDQFIYEILAVGDEWSPYVKPHVGLSQPKVLGFSKRNSESFLQTAVSNPKLGTNDQGGVDFAHRLLSVAEFMVHVPVNPHDWMNEFPEFQPNGNMINLEMNPQIAQIIKDTILNGVQDEIADIDFQGDTTLGTYLKFYDGFNKLALADANVIDVANVGVITVSNILSILGSIKKAIPFRLRNKGQKLNIFMNYQDYDLAQDANKLTQNSQAIAEMGDFTAYEKTYPLIPMKSIPKNTIMATIAGTGNESNLAKGYWFEPDSENFILAKENPGDKLWKFLMRAKMGVQYRYGGDIVLYTGS